jgi:tRNA G18 (ribose-2'-O)-methylase SpoU
MPVEVIDNLDDPRLDVFRHLKATNQTRRTNTFIAEGQLVIERLLASEFELISVLASRRMERRIVPIVPPQAPLFVVDNALAERLVGFTFHTGVLACGLRKPSPPLEALVKPGAGLAIGVCANVNDPENIGAIIRLCAGFGIDGLLLGPGCADPFSRRVLRVSMGTAFFVPIRETADLAGDLVRLRDEFRVELCAAVVDPSAEPLSAAKRAERTALLFGNEKHGLDPHMVGLCNRRLTIPMIGGADSLNVAVAAGVFFYHVMRVAPLRAPVPSEDHR